MMNHEYVVELYHPRKPHRMKRSTEVLVSLAECLAKKKNREILVKIQTHYLQYRTIIQDSTPSFSIIVIFNLPPSPLEDHRETDKQIMLVLTLFDDFPLFPTDSS